MTRTISKQVWKGRDNYFKLRLESISVDEDGRQVVTPTDLGTVENILFELENQTLDLTVDAGDVDPPIDWWSSGLETGEMQFTLGHSVEAIDPGNYVCRLTLFSSTTPGGVVWMSYADRGLAVTIHDTAGT